jgi:hypothetical protein
MSKPHKRYHTHVQTNSLGILLHSFDGGFELWSEFALEVGGFVNGGALGNVGDKQVRTVLYVKLDGEVLASLNRDLESFVADVAEGTDL